VDMVMKATLVDNRAAAGTSLATTAVLQVAVVVE
jgi:hypothetical protein